MDLQLELTKAIGRKSQEGNRKLELNKFRCSQAVKGARALYHDKTEPEFEWDWDNPREGIEYYIDNLGIWHVPHAIGTAVQGTLMHEFIQSALGIQLLGAEILVIDEDGELTRDGHVDLKYNDDTYNMVIGDIKSTNKNVMTWGIKGCSPITYTSRKIIKDTKQGNEYAVMSGVNMFNILQVDRDDWAHYLAWYVASRDIDKQIKDKCKRVLEAVRNREPPLDCDNALCELKGKFPHYCRHHHEYPGVDKSDANCPGRLKLAEMRENRKLTDEYGE